MPSRLRNLNANNLLVTSNFISLAHTSSLNSGLKIYPLVRYLHLRFITRLRCPKLSFWFSAPSHSPNPPPSLIALLFSMIKDKFKFTVAQMEILESNLMTLTLTQHLTWKYIQDLTASHCPCSHHLHPNHHFILDG